SIAGGIKVSLFNVTNVKTPTLTDSVDIGGPGSESEVFTDPKAFLFDRQKNLMVLPVFLQGLPITQWTYPNSNYTYMANGTLTGSYVFGVDPVRGFTVQGTVIHANNRFSAS